MNHLTLADTQYLAAYFTPRDGETKIAQHLQFVNGADTDLLLALQRIKENGVRFILLGVPEDIGPRANLGRGGSNHGWSAFLSRFANLQQNSFIKGNEIALLGHINVDDLQQQSERLDSSNAEQLTSLRQLVSEIDSRLTPVIKAIAEAGLMPIIIGGGHNNALPIIAGISQAFATPISAINLDPHSDFRALEGRHSGNGFHYASDAGLLSHYFCLGLHELKNSAASINGLNQRHFPFVSYQQIYVRREMTLAQALQDASCYLSDSNRPIGVELDLDSISFMPASAYTNAGVDLSDAQYYVHTIATLPNSCYLHLTEGAPCQHPSGMTAGVSDVGQGYAALVCSFIQAKQEIGA